MLICWVELRKIGAMKNRLMLARIRFGDVVDTGLGRRNGATVAKVARQLAPHNRLFLTTTHFHPEHAAGVLGFPLDTVLIRDQVQQDEMDRHGEEMVSLFAGRNELRKGRLRRVIKARRRNYRSWRWMASIPFNPHSSS